MKTRFVSLVAVLILLATLSAGCTPGDLTEPFYASDLYPNANNTGNVGGVGLQWLNGHFLNLFVNGVPIVPGVGGSIWYNGAGAPAPGLGNNGDYYLNSTNGDVYTKAAGAWGIVANIAGPAGPPGVPGAPGSVWYSGVGVPGVGLGIDGDFYLDTANGDVYAKAGGVWGVVDNITGPAGAPGGAGAPGAVWFSGAGAPAGGLGIDGDYYLNTTNGDVYSKAAGVWGIIGNILGPQGIQGIQGLQGIQGIPGTPGADGANGAPGSVWYSGAGAPGAGLGLNGDFYLNTTNGDVYEKAGGAWGVITNITGPTGAAGADGLSIVWHGAYDNGHAYIVNDAVSYLGSSYICIVNSTGNLPTDAGFWNLLASKGDTGAAGPAGINMLDYFVDIRGWDSLDGWTSGGVGSGGSYPRGGNLYIYTGQQTNNDRWTGTANLGCLYLLVSAGKTITQEWIIANYGTSDNNYAHTQASWIMTETQNGYTFTDSQWGWKIKSGTNSNIWATCGNHTTETETNTGVTLASGNQFTRLRTVFIVGTSIKYYINGSLVATHSTNLPSTTYGNMYYSIYLKTTQPWGITFYVARTFTARDY